MKSISRYKCFNCGGDCPTYYDINGNPKSARCDKCNEKMHMTTIEIENRMEEAKKEARNKRIEEKRKQLNGKHPFSVLAEMKLMLHRSKGKFRQSKNGWWVSASTDEGKESILQECEDILEAYDIPPKYLIAETLDSKEE